MEKTLNIDIISAYNSSFSSPQFEQAISAALLQEKSSYNITQDKKKNYASLTEAIAAVSDEKYKVNGLVLTFYTGTEWVSKRYNGADASGFATEDNWVDAGGAGGASEHTLDLSPLFDEGGDPVATVTDEFLAEVKKAYEESWSNCKFEMMFSIAPLFITNMEGVYQISFIYNVFNGSKNTAVKNIFLISSSDKSVTVKSVVMEEIPMGEGSGTKALTDNGKYAEFASPVKVENGGSGTVTKQLSPNTLYEFGECTSLTITLVSEISGIRNEYMFEFVSGTTPTMLSIPETVGWMGGEAPNIEANKTYQCSIVNNIAVIGGK